MEFIKTVNDLVYSVVGGIPMIGALLITGIFCTFFLGGIQFRRFGLAFKSTFSKLFSKTDKGDGSLTPFQALCTALASTVGTGSIAGVAGAIALGGPGAIFWMWVSALFGMATKYSEIVLAIHYREKNAKGEWIGGPMYYIKNGLGKKWKWLGALFAVFCALAALGTGNMTQVNTIVGTVDTAMKHFFPTTASHLTLINWITGILIAGVAALVLFGGLTRIGALTEKMIPLMSALFILGSVVIVCCNAGQVGAAFGLIFRGAFNPQAVCGGIVGMTVMRTMSKGVGRGIFSNEAGLGSAPIAHASANTDSPVKQGLFGIFEVFITTIVICTLTALTILTSGIDMNYGQEASASLTTSAFATIFGEGVADIFMFLVVGMFALSTLIGWALYGRRCCEFLFGEKSGVVYNVIYIVVAVLGAVTENTLVWALSDTLNCFMAIPNLISIIALSGVVKKVTKSYFEKDSMLTPETATSTKENANL